MPIGENPTSPTKTETHSHDLQRKNKNFNPFITADKVIILL